MIILYEDLLLRNMRADDLEAIHNFACLEEICQYQAWGPNTPEDTKNFVDSAINETKQSPRQNCNLVVSSLDGQSSVPVGFIADERLKVSLFLPSASGKT